MALFQQRSCQSCSFYRQMGERGFCFKHSKVISSASGCDDFAPKMDEEMKKRWYLENKGTREHGAEIEGFDKITVTEHPSGTEGFTLPKKDRVKEKIFIDTKTEGEMTSKPRTDASEQGQNLFLAILIGGLVILIVILFATGVF